MNQNQNNRYKNIRVWIVPVIALVLIVGAFFFSTHHDSRREGPYLEIDTLNVGKADCMIITDGDHTILMDTGTANASNYICDHLKKKNVAKIDLMIITHYDQDHIGSASTLVNKFTIEDLILPDYMPEKMDRLEQLLALPTTNAPKLLSRPYSAYYGDIKLDIWPCKDPQAMIQKKVEKGKEFDNDQSLVTMLTYKEKKFLFTGDIEKDRSIELLEDDSLNLKADWIKMPEHGRYQKKLPELIERVDPTYAVISTSNEEEPAEKTLNLLNERNIEYYGTYDGDIETICCNGEISLTIR